MITILVVEDDAKLNKIVCASLSDRGYKSISCLSATEDFDKMIDIKADLIISDIMMPGIDGFKLAALVREQDKIVPIMFMSSRDDLSAKEKGFRIGYGKTGCNGRTAAQGRRLAPQGKYSQRKETDSRQPYP